MLPENLHIEQINRFHKIMKDLDGKIDAEHDEKKKGELCMKYYHLDKLWIEIDDFIEFTLRHKLDIIQREI